MKHIYTALLIVISMCGSVHAMDYCPSSIIVEHHVVAVPDGYITSAASPQKATLTFAEVVWGEPSKTHGLLPDNEAERIAQWSFTPEIRQKPHWIGCYYHPGDIALFIQFHPEHWCRLEMHPQPSAPGNPQSVKRMWCQ